MNIEDIKKLSRKKSDKRKLIKRKDIVNELNSAEDHLDSLMLAFLPMFKIKEIQFYMGYVIALKFCLGYSKNDLRFIYSSFL